MHRLGLAVAAFFVLLAACGVAADEATGTASTQADAPTATVGVPESTAAPLAATAAPPATTSPATDTASTTTADAVPPATTAETAAADITARDRLTATLDSLRTAAETDGGFVRSHYEHHSGHLCDTSGHDPYTGVAFSPDSCDVDHIVAAKEAHESGGASWSIDRRREFGNYPLNLVASRDCVNRSKSSHDISGWSAVKSGPCAGSSLTTAGACFWAARTIAVKDDFGLAVDSAERTALDHALSGCPPDIDPRAGSATAHRPSPTVETDTKTGTAPKTTAPASSQRTCTHDGRGHGYLGYNPGTHTHPTSDHGPHETGKCAGV